MSIVLHLWHTNPDCISKIWIMLNYTIVVIRRECTHFIRLHIIDIYEHVLHIVFYICYFLFSFINFVHSTPFFSVVFFIINCVSVCLWYIYIYHFKWFNFWNSLSSDTVNRLSLVKFCNKWWIILFSHDFITDIQFYLRYRSI